MRLLRLGAVTALLVILASCVDERGGDNPVTGVLTVISEQLSGDRSPSQMQSKGDLLSFWDEDADNKCLQLSAIQSETRASYGGSISGVFGTCFAATPYNKANSISKDGMLSVHCSDLYSARGDTLQSGMPMFGKSFGPAVMLSHLGGVLDLPVVGGARFAKLQFTVLDRGKYASGVYSVDTRRDMPMDSIVFSGAGRSVTLECGEEIVLNYTDTAHFYFPLPAQDYFSYELAVETEGLEPAIVRVDDAPFRIERGRVTTATPLVLRSAAPLLDFRFCPDQNPRAQGDIVLRIDHNERTAKGRIKYYLGMNGAVPTFTLPEGFTAWVDGEQQFSGVTPQNFYHPVTYEIRDGEGLSTAYTVEVEHFTGLPVIFIETPDAAEITSRDYWMEGVSMRIDGVGRYEDYDSANDFVNIKGRGNATWVKFPKKAFNMKLNKRHSLLGMPSHKRWCFIANYRDRTRLGNRISYYIARHLSGMDWNPRTEFAEVFYNGKHRGMYLLTEQIRIDPNRVPVTEFEEDEDGNLLNVNEETVSGGYIFQLDNVFNEPFHFHTAIRNIPVEFKAPKENIPEIMFNYGQNLFNSLEQMLSEGQFEQAYELLDIDSFVDFWMVAELSGNQDATTPRSDFMHKDRGGKLMAGPIWDYDAFTYWRASGLRMNNALWYRYLFNDKTFCAKVKEHWVANKPFLETIPDYIDSQIEYIRESERLDADLWTPMLGLDSIQGDEFWTFREATDRMKEVYLIRLQLLDEFVNGLVTE